MQEACKLYQIEDDIRAEKVMVEERTVGKNRTFLNWLDTRECPLEFFIWNCYFIFMKPIRFD